MIHAARITKGWPVEQLDAFRPKKAFRFKPGANVLFGKNGSGKTTLLKLIGGFSGCPEHGGWSELPQLRSLDKTLKFPACMAKNAHVGEIAASVAWDGTPTFMHLAAKSDEPAVALDMPHDVLDFGAQISMLMSKASTGQGRAIRLEKVLRRVKFERPDMLALKPEDWDDTSKRFLAYVRRLPREGPHTLLLDEPERALDVDAQVLFWQRILPAVAKELQVIVTSHSPFALFVPGVNVVDMTPGYSNEMRERVTALFASWKATKPVGHQAFIVATRRSDGKAPGLVKALGVAAASVDHAAVFHTRKDAEAFKASLGSASREAYDVFEIEVTVGGGAACR